MSLKTRLRIAIVTLVTVVVVALSALYFYDFTEAAFTAAHDGADLIARQVKGYLLDRIRTESAQRGLHPATLAESKALWTDILRSDSFLPLMLELSVASADVVENIQIVGEDGIALASSNPSRAGRPTPSLDTFGEILHRNAFANLWDLLNRHEDYVLVLPLGAAGQKQPIFRIAVEVQSALLYNYLRSPLRKLRIAFAVSLVAAIILAMGLPSVVLNPLERIGRRIDMIRSGQDDSAPLRTRPETREFAALQSKLNLLGQQFRGARQDATELRSNLDEMLRRLEETVLFFDASDRLVMAGQPAERLLNKPREEMLGRTLAELFPLTTPLGLLAAEAGGDQPVRDRPIIIERAGGSRTRVVASVQILRRGEGQPRIGTFITLKDADTRRQLQLQFDVSSRLAAIGRLTSGVAHEIKNPLNAMALHLEVLKSKLGDGDPEIDVISKEIKRLDRVVRTFLNFNRPVEMNSRPLDLTHLAVDLVDLIRPDATSRGIEVETALDQPGWINGDADLLKQAILNVMMNGIEAMNGSGTLRIATRQTEEECLVEIADNGPGIAPEIRDKIFNLYFSTKQSGSGIGLAMAFRVIQFHSGTIDVTSESGKGTSFQLRFPALSDMDSGRANERAAGS